MNDTSDIFSMTKLRPKGREMAVTKPLSYFIPHVEYAHDSVGIWRVDGEAEVNIEMAVGMCDDAYEIIETNNDVYILLIDTGTMGWCRRTIPKWAVDRIITKKEEPEYYV